MGQSSQTGRPSDEALMRDVQGGDIAAFETLVERHKSVVFGLCYSMLRSREDAEEAAQDTFVKVFRARERFDSAQRLEPWLFRIAGNTCRDLLRRRRIDTQPQARSVEADRLAHLVVDPRSTSRGWSEATRGAVRHEIEQLSDKLRLPVVLRYVNGLTNQQVADALGISLSNVKIRLGRAKDVLQSRLDQITEAR